MLAFSVKTGNYTRQSKDIIINLKYWVYIITTKHNKVLYTGMTNNIERRLSEHQNKVYSRSFSKRYNVNKLVYFEEFSSAKDALLREKQIKKWNRSWKIALIKQLNPELEDLSQGL